MRQGIRVHFDHGCTFINIMMSSVKIMFNVYVDYHLCNQGCELINMFMKLTLSDCNTRPSMLNCANSQCKHKFILGKDTSCYELRQMFFSQCHRFHHNHSHVVVCKICKILRDLHQFQVKQVKNLFLISK